MDSLEHLPSGLVFSAVEAGAGGTIVSMADARFTTSASTLEELLAAVDLDDVGDLGTLLTLLFGRPISVEEAVDEDDETVLETVIWTGEMGAGVRRWYPMTLVDLTRHCAATVAEMGPDTFDDGFPVDKQRDISAMGAEELLSALMDALGKVRIFNVLNADEG